ncbi:MAG: hypothetical protein KJZ57_00800 [Anaerolineales bacterium]|nr:hypothetical protein [Anaerolineales bacterium]
MRAEEGDGEVERAFVVEREQGFEQAQFAGRGEAVTRFRLGGRRSVREHAEQARTRLGDQRFEAGCARRADGGDDPAARGEDVEIVGAGHFHLELVGAVARPDEMGVRVHEAGHQHAAAGVEAGLVGIGGAQFVGLADREDLLVADDDRAVRDDAEVAEALSALQAAREGEELGGGVDEHGRDTLTENEGSREDEP